MRIVSNAEADGPDSWYATFMECHTIFERRLARRLLREGMSMRYMIQGMISAEASWQPGVLVKKKLQIRES